MKKGTFTERFKRALLDCGVLEKDIVKITESPHMVVWRICELPGVEATAVADLLRVFSAVLGWCRGDEENRKPERLGVIITIPPIKDFIDALYFVNMLSIKYWGHTKYFVTYRKGCLAFYLEQFYLPDYKSLRELVLHTTGLAGEFAKEISELEKYRRKIWSC